MKWPFVDCGINGYALLTSKRINCTSSFTVEFKTIFPLYIMGSGLNVNVRNSISSFSVHFASVVHNHSSDRSISSFLRKLPTKVLFFIGKIGIFLLFENLYIFIVSHVIQGIQILHKFIHLLKFLYFCAILV